MKPLGAWFWDFAGSVAMVCVWKRVLADAEIREFAAESICNSSALATFYRHVCVACEYRYSMYRIH